MKVRIVKMSFSKNVMAWINQYKKGAMYVVRAELFDKNYVRE
jgi:hypothetical protein